MITPESLWRTSTMLHQRGRPRLARLLKHINSVLYHNSLATGAHVGRNLYLGHHGLGVVVNDRVTIGDGVKIWHNVTLAVRAPTSPEHRITIEDHVMVGANSIIITPRSRPLVIGRGARIGAGTVVTRDVPAGATVVGPAGRIIKDSPNIESGTSAREQVPPRQLPQCHTGQVGTSEEQRSVWKVYGSRTIYDNPWIKLDLVDLEQPDGHRFEHHVVRLRTAAVAVMLDEHDRVLMLWRHRFVADRWGFELPGGLVDPGEQPIETIAREIEEETGYRASRIDPLLSFEPMVGMVDSPHHLFLARDLERVGEPTEVTESARLQWIPLSSVQNLIAKGEIWNSGTLIALMHVLLSHHKD